VDAFINIGAPSAPMPILLHNGREARSIGRLVVAKQPPYDRQPCPRRHPLPSSGLPAQIDLKSALRLDLTLGAVQTGWIRPEKFVASAAPAFRAKAGHPFGLADCLCSGRASPLSSRRQIRRRGAETRPVALPASLRQSNRGRPRGQPRRASRPR
jgi:hypothetical protein